MIIDELLFIGICVYWLSISKILLYFRIANYALKFVLKPSKSLLHASKLLLKPSEPLLHASKLVLHASKSLLHASKLLLKPSEWLLKASKLVLHASNEIEYDSINGWLSPLEVGKTPPL